MGMFSDAADALSSDATPDTFTSRFDSAASALSGPVVTKGTQGQPRILISPPKPSSVSGTRDFVQSLPGGMVSGLSGVLSATGQAAQAEMAQPIDVPSPQQTEAILQQSVTGPLPQPQGVAGQYGRTVGQFVAQAPFSPPIPGVGPVTAGVGAVGAGLASETAGQALAGTPLEGAARVTAPIVGGLLARRPSPVTEAQALNVGRQVAEVPTTQELFTAAKGPGGYPAAESGPIFQPGQKQVSALNAGGVPVTKTVIDPSKMDKLASDTHTTMEAGGSDNILAPKTFGTVEKLKEQNSVEGIQKVRVKLNTIAEKGDKFEVHAATMAKQAIDSFLKENAPEQAAILSEANANFGAAARAKAADVREDIATLRQKRAGYGSNARFVAATRQILSPIVEKALKGNPQGHSPEEIQAMRDIVEGNTLTNTLRGMGMVSPEKGILSFAVAGELAEKLGPEVAGTIAGLSWISNKLNTAVTMKQIERLNEMLRKRSPLYEKAVKGAADRYTQTMNDFANSPTQQSFVKFLVASRNFSAGLRKDGIPLSSGDLLKGIKATGDNEGNENQ